MMIYKNSRKRNFFTNINVTPLTDIALTLLVVFMVATPIIIETYIKVDLPKVENKNDLIDNNNLIITIDETSNIFIKEKVYNLNSLKKYLKENFEKNKKQNIIINGDRKINYEIVVKVLDIVKNSGLTKISLGIESN